MDDDEFFMILYLVTYRVPGDHMTYTGGGYTENDVEKMREKGYEIIEVKPVAFI